jgi:hypothetical protein
LRKLNYRIEISIFHKTVADKLFLGKERILFLSYNRGHAEIQRMHAL